MRQSSFPYRYRPGGKQRRARIPPPAAGRLAVIQQASRGREDRELLGEEVWNLEEPVSGEELDRRLALHSLVLSLRPAFE